jgi:DNA-binding XRE family transcriptional regulator
MSAPVCQHAGDRQDQDAIDGGIDTVCCSCGKVLESRLSVAQIENTLAQCQGGDEFFRSPYGFTYTEGARFVFEACKAYWLLDVIGSYQPKCRRDGMLAEFQIWQLDVDGSKAVVRCLRDTDDEALRQAIPYTDFPLESIRLLLRHAQMGPADVRQVSRACGERQGSRLLWSLRPSARCRRAGARHHGMTPSDLRTARNSLGLSQVEMAERLGVDVMTVSRWERGQREIPLTAALAVAHLSCRQKRKRA